MNLDRRQPEILTPAAAPASLLHPANHHHQPRNHSENPAET
jgi:hypothetical protein